MKESHIRSIVKSILYRATNTGATIALVYIFTGKIQLAVSVGFFEILAKISFYFMYERMWNHIKWGLK